MSTAETTGLPPADTLAACVAPCRSKRSKRRPSRERAPRARAVRESRAETWPAPGDGLAFAGLEAFSLRTVEDNETDFGPRLRAMIERRCVDWGDLPAENDNGCVEYKWRLGSEHDGPQRAQRLATQMKFRLGEGGGTAFYLLGVRDCGAAVGLPTAEHAAAVRVLMGIAAVMGSVLLLEAVSEQRRGGKRCSAWRVESRRAAMQQAKDILHLVGGAELRSGRQASPEFEDKAPTDTSVPTA